MKNKILMYIILVVAVCFGGELKFYPIEANIRVSLGTPIFFFFLLWSKQIKPVQAGFIVGLSVVIFRTLLPVLIYGQFYWFDTFFHHAPVFFYYFMYGLFFFLFKTKEFYNRPIIMVLIGVIIENIASLAEVSIRHYFSTDWISLNNFLIIFLISIIRSFFVLGFFSFFLLREANITEAFQRNRNEEMLVLVSDLFVEMVQLKKSMKNAENITKTCYDLYRNLTIEKNSYAKTALNIAGEVHEIKKDHQRIYSSLSKLKVKKLSTDLLTIEDIIDVAIQCNQRYANTLEKHIDFKVFINGEHPPYNCFIVLSLINNLITNSIEAIQESGTIIVLVEKEGDFVNFEVQDDGPGIPNNKLELVFEPGYTSKYDILGIASNGIGLSHIKEVIERLSGKINLTSNQEKKKTSFLIQLPVHTIDSME